MQHYGKIILMSLAMLLTFIANPQITKSNELIQNDILEENLSSSSPFFETHEPIRIVKPLPRTLSMNSLNDRTFAASFNNSNISLEDGALNIHMKIYDYELFDLVDISLLKEGDIIILNGNAVSIESLEQLESGLIRINGGTEEGGHDLMTDNSGVYYETTMDMGRKYFAIGEATFKVDQDFKFLDQANLKNSNSVYYAGDLIILKNTIDFSCTAYDSSITVKDGSIINITRKYTP